MTSDHIGEHPPSKLKMAVSDQPCSSSPISVRDASAESVVLPVPDRPKKIAVSPSAPMLAEQCIGMTPCGGRTKLRTVKTRSEEHTSELQSLMRISYAVFCLKKKKHQSTTRT